MRTTVRPSTVSRRNCKKLSRSTTKNGVHQKMNNEGTPTPPRFFSTFDSRPTNPHNDVLQKFKTNKRKADENLHRFDDTLSSAKLTFYTRTWYTFYAVDNPIKQISVFPMMTHHLTTHLLTSDDRPTDYSPTAYRSTEYRSTEHRPTASRRTAYRSTEYSSTAHRSTEYQSTAYRPSVVPHTVPPNTGLPNTVLPALVAPHTDPPNTALLHTVVPNTGLPSYRIPFH